MHKCASTISETLATINNASLYQLLKCKNTLTEIQDKYSFMLLEMQECWHVDIKARHSEHAVL